MAPRLKVGAKDLSAYLRLQPDEGLDPLNSAFFRPQFQGIPALGEGQTWTADAIDNRTMNIPLYLTASSRAEMKTIGQEINALLVKGSQVEFALDPSVDSSTFFDLERGSLSEEFNYYHQINTVQSCTLTLVCRPYGNTATKRLVASVPMASSAAVMFAATGVLGDTSALANFEVRVGSAVATHGRVVAWGVHPHPSHLGWRQASQGMAQAGATLIGASGAVGSQYVGIPVSPTGASGITYTQFLDPPSAHIGRHRVVGLVKSALNNTPINIAAYDRFGAIIGPTAVASQVDRTKWQMIDFGEINIPARASGQDTVPTQYVTLRAGAATKILFGNGSPGFHLNGLAFIPLDYSAGILRTPGAEGAAQIFSINGGESNLPVSEGGVVWTQATGLIGFRGGLWPGMNLEGVFARFPSPGIYSLADAASGARYGDVFVRAGVRLVDYEKKASGRASGTFVDVWAKRQPGSASAGVWARLTLGPSQSLAMYAGNGASTALLGSAGIPTTLASGLWEGIQHILGVQTLGNTANAWLGTQIVGPPVLTASHAIVGITGNPAFGGKQGTANTWSEEGVETPGGGANTGVMLGGAAQPLAAFISQEAPPDILPREWFRVEAHPQGRAYQGNASVFVTDCLANYRGQFPNIPNVGSPMATGPARVTVLSGEVDNFIGNDGFDTVLAVLERFRYLR